MFQHGSTFPFAAYITHLRKYTEGALVGEWLQFPTTREKLQETFQKIGLKDGEEYFISDYDMYVPGLSNVLGEYENLDELNYLALQLYRLSDYGYKVFEAAIDLGADADSLQQLINLTYNLDVFTLYSDIEDYDDLGRMYLEELSNIEVPDEIKDYIDYEAYGRDMSVNETFTFSPHGFIYLAHDDFGEEYDGTREEIPLECRITGTSDEEIEEVTKVENSIEDAKLSVLCVEPHKEPYMKSIESGLKSLQAEVQGSIQATYPFSDPVAIICNDEGKVNGMELNRALRDQNEVIYDVIAGPFLVAGLTDDNFASLSPELAEKYMSHFKDPEIFAFVNDELTAIPVPEKEIKTYDIYQLKHTPDIRDYSFQSLNQLFEKGLEVSASNYDTVYSGTMHPQSGLESLYTKFNIDLPEDFTGHSLSISDVIVITQNGTSKAYYCDTVGFEEIPVFFNEPIKEEPDITFYFSECMEFPTKGEYHDNLSLKEAAALYKVIPGDLLAGIKGIGFTLHDGSMYDDMDFPLVQGNILNLDNLQLVQHYLESSLVRDAVKEIMVELPNLDISDYEGYLRNAELAIEDDYNMIDGIINNGEKDITPPGASEKTSVRERLSEAKRACSEVKPPEPNIPIKDNPEQEL